MLPIAWVSKVFHDYPDGVCYFLADLGYCMTLVKLYIHITQLLLLLSIQGLH